MKKHILLLSALALVSIQSCQKSNAGRGLEAAAGTPRALNTADASAQPDCPSFLQEVALDFGSRNDPSNDYFYTSAKVRAGIELFHQAYRYKDESMSQPSDLIDEPGKLSIGGIKTMIADTRLLMQGSKKPYLCGLKMRYGLLNRTMVLIYEPIALVDPRLEDGWIADTLGTGMFYRTNAAGTPEPIGRVEMEKYTENYRQHIYINHLEPDQLTVHSFVNNDGNPRLGDVHHCVMPVQELVRLYLDNLDDCTQVNDADVVSLSLVANPLSRMPEAGYSKNLRPHVAVYTSRLGAGLTGNGFQYLAADFTQVCPPNCRTVHVAPFAQAVQ